MLGIVFTEFLEMVEDRFGDDVADLIIEDAGVNGAYTAVGNYPFADLVSLVVALEKRSSLPTPVLIETFGEHLFHQFSNRYADLLVVPGDILDFLEGIEARIHTEVRKLYPNAELPTIYCQRLAANRLVMHYESPRCLGHLAVGLLKGSASHFGTPLDISVAEDLSQPKLTLTIQTGQG